MLLLVRASGVLPEVVARVTGITVTIVEPLAGPALFRAWLGGVGESKMGG